MVEEIKKEITTTSHIKFKNTMKGLGWEITDSQREGEADLKKSCERIEVVNKLLIEKFGEAGERKKEESED